MLKILPLAKHHDRQGFDCGVEPLNKFLRQTARQHIEKGLSVTTILVDDGDPDRILGFYTLAFTEVEPGSLPAAVSKSLPSNRLPAIKLARLAVSTREQGKGYGKALLIESMKDALQASKKAGGVAFFVDAKDESAASFYRKYGFESLPGVELHLIMPMNCVEKALSFLPQ